MSSRYSILLGKVKSPKPGLKIFRESISSDRDVLSLSPDVRHSCEYSWVRNHTGFVCKCGLNWKYMEGLNREQWDEQHGF
jgi:hypothetical protein